MSEATPKNIARAALLATWGMVTLVLVCVVGMLMYKMYQQDQAPVSFSETSVTVSSTATSTPQTSTTLTEVALYFASSTETSLVTQSQRLALGRNTVENCRTALDALIAGPTSSTLSPILAPKTKIRAMYLRDNNELVIDFSRELEAGHVHSASADMLLVEGVAKTLTQSALHAENDRRVSSIRFLFEGSPYQGTFPAHYDLSVPVSLASSSGSSSDAQ